MHVLRYLALGLVLALTTVGLAACGGESDDSSAAAGAGGGTTTTMTDMSGDNGESSTGTTEDGTASGEVSVESPAADLRASLDQLLGEHAYLAMFATQKGLAGDKDFKAIAAALDENTADLGDAIGSVYGEEARKKFLDGDLLWRDHIKFFVDYTGGLAQEDKAAQKEAVDNLMGYNEAISVFLSDATGLPKDALAESFTTHITQLKGQIDAYSNGNYEQAYTTALDAYDHMFMAGDTLAGGIVESQGDMFPMENATESAVDLRVTLGNILGEHAMLAMMATQKGYAGEKDFEQITNALDQNTEALGQALEGVYGAEAAQKFLDGKLLWRDHIQFFVDYTVGLANKDKAAQNEAVDGLMAYNEAVSVFLSDATGLPKDALAEGFEMHIMQLKGQIDAYAAGDYDEAYRLAREAHAHMWETATTLSSGIVAQSPDQFGS